MTIIAATCNDCGDFKIKASKAKMVGNLSRDTWDFVAKCPMCELITVRPLDTYYFNLLKKSGVKVKTMVDPVLSKRPWGPPLDNVDLFSFRESLNMHDHLAAYA